MFAIKMYAFGGLAFMVAVIATAVAYWIWVVVIKREFADSPPELDLHPEVWELLRIYDDTCLTTSSSTF